MTIADPRRQMIRPGRITVVTAGHLSTCPRMLKSADALAADGYDVRVVATHHEPRARGEMAGRDDGHTRAAACRRHAAYIVM